jgi:hypothetical protein
MSIRSEQYRALKLTKEFIYDLFDPKKYPKTKKEMREKASRCTRHFPPLEESGKPIFSRDTLTKD